MTIQYSTSAACLFAFVVYLLPKSCSHLDFVSVFYEGWVAKKTEGKAKDDSTCSRKAFARYRYRFGFEAWKIAWNK
jgi:hypothetical protein